LPPFSGRTLFPAAILLVGLNLRPLLASVGPLLDTIQHDTALGDTGASLLTAVPVMLMGLCLLGTGRVQALLGPHAGILLGMVLIATACLGRLIVPDAPMLIGTAILGGMGIATVQALMPAVIRRHYGARAAGMMGLYSTAIMGAHCSPALPARASRRTVAGRSRSACGVDLPCSAWACGKVPACHRQEHRRHAGRHTGSGPDSGHPAIAAIAARLDIAVLLRPGHRRLYARSGLAAALLHPAGLVVGGSRNPAVAGDSGRGRGRHRRVVPGEQVSRSAPLLFPAIGALLAGLLCLTLAPLALAWLAAILVGTGIGALFPLSLIVAMDHGEDPAQAGQIVGFVQGGGYLLAALLPFGAGVMRAHLSDLAPAWWLMIGLCGVLPSLPPACAPANACSSPKRSPSSPWSCKWPSMKRTVAPTTS
jgi:CP family cyanate transporter-like MFS transporter